MEKYRQQDTYIPEPSILVIFGLGILGLGFARLQKCA
ncbi:MAG: PEP-CTERM sorting domain-containing protein [Proteobacteria bacterium]|nr:PEP-CTERM sorting domain-containing protein [Pseudomonadota bacterium]